jgi:hypothetical protein
MSRDELRDAMIAAVELEQGFEALRCVVKALLAAGQPGESLLEDLSSIRALVSEDLEDKVLDVMDLLTGWCAPSERLV